MGDVDKIICAMNPDRYYNGTPREISKFKQLIKKQGLDEGIKEAKPKPASEHNLTYDSTTETLEQLYFWILDFMNDAFGGDVTKINDNFASSPGSGHFSELRGKATQLQQQVSTIMGAINQMLKSVINLLYDLKEFRVRLDQYDEADSKDEKIREAGILALKLVWMDKVDILRGQGSINAMSSGNLQFVTLRDAFMKVMSLKEVDKLDLNDRVKRILKPRIQEFFDWKKRSEQELRKRFEIEKNYLKSQVNTLKLEARWAKPYLKAIEKLEQSEKLESSPDLVTAFNTILLELTLLGKNTTDVNGSVISGDLPKDFAKIKNLRKYNSVILINFDFRGIPSKQGQHYSFGGKSEVIFRSYALTDNELALLNEKLSDSDLDSALKLIQGMTDDSLQQLKTDIDGFLEETPEEKQEKIKIEDGNPFSALFSFTKSAKKEKIKEDEKKKTKEFEEKGGFKPESYAEKYIRNLTEANAINLCFSIYDIYKKAHGMASFPYTTDAEAEAPLSKAEKLFGFK